jgi:hypothetical protein
MDPLTWNAPPFALPRTGEIVQSVPAGLSSPGMQYSSQGIRSVSNMRRTTIPLIVFASAVLLAACADAEVALLPTSTPAPIPPVPTSTATPLPPPTVTAFPTATPGGALLEAPVEEVVEEVVEEEPTAEELEEEEVPAVEEEEEQPPEPTETPEPTSEPAPQEFGVPDDVELGKQVFSGDFFQGWPEIDDGDSRVYLANGEYNFEVGHRVVRFVATTALDLRDMYAQVEAMPQTCPEGAGYGLSYRYQDEDNHYVLNVSCKNRLTAHVRINGVLQSEPLLDEALPSDVDAASYGPHLIGVMAKGNNVAVYFDGEEIGSFSDSTHRRGDIAIYAAGYGVNVFEIAFDNLKVWEIR